MKVKPCEKCGITKAITEFVLNKDCMDGRAGTCKECRKERNRARRQKDPEKYKAYNREAYFKNIEKSKEDRRRWRLDNPERVKEMNRKWYARNRIKLLEYKRQWLRANPEKAREMSRRANAARRSTIAGRLNHSMATRLSIALRGVKKGEKWESLVTFTVNQLKSHIEKQFLPGMTWENYGEWHIDHKTPISAFNFVGPSDIDFKRCWELKNLQPMWATDNIRKGHSVNRPFQPALAIAIQPCAPGVVRAEGAGR